MIALVASVVPAGAVGLGPLMNSGLTLSDRKGFYLTLINPYATRETFRLYGIAWSDETPDARVVIPVNEVALGAGAQRRILVVYTGLEPGEEHRFRVCAQRAGPRQEALIDARVCSKLVARRVG